MKLLLMALVYGLIQGLVFVLNTMYGPALAGQPYYLAR